MSGKTTFTWLGAAGFLIERPGTVLVTDPFLSRPKGVEPFPLPRDALARATGILCTHGHFDHAMDLEQVARLSEAPIWAPAVVCRRLESLGIARERLNENERTSWARVGSISLTVVPSRHITFDAPIVAETLLAAISGKTFRELLALGMLWPMGSNSDFLLRAGGFTAYLAGSLGQSPEALRSQHCQVALLPYNGRTDIPRVTLQAVEALRPRVLVLHHWDDFYPHLAPPQDPAKVVPLLEERFPELKVHIARMGEPFAPEAWL